jgi:epoxyqueuosine reductase
MGNRIYGCDDCLAVCPWNKFAEASHELKLTAPDWRDPPLSELAALDDEGFRRAFAGGPIKRIGHVRFLRNVLIAIGNSDDPALLPALRPHLDSPSALVRGAAVWALCRLARDEAVARRRDDPDEHVAAEWARAE